MSTTTAPLESHLEAPTEGHSETTPAPGWISRTARHPITRLIGRTYITLLLLATTVQAVVLFLVWKWPSYDWGSLLDRFITSPAMAGLFAVVAAVIGAWSLHRQLTHTKQKADDEAWWEQFQWVTDRIVSPDGDKAAKAKDRLPKSLAYNLMTALSKSARADFQKAAVAGIFRHHLRDAAPPEQDETAISDEPRMDATEAESLRALLAVVPDDSTSSATAHRLLNEYDRYIRYREYEDEVQRALRHRFGDYHSVPPAGNFGADAVIDMGSHKLVIEVKQSIPGRSILLKTINRLRSVMDREGANAGIIVTPPLPPTLNAKKIEELNKDRIYLVEWDPSEKSGALKERIQKNLPYVYRS
jgi:hypothetical protein